MIPKAADIIDIIEGYAPPGRAESWDNSGLQVGDPNAAVKIAAVALDADEYTVSSAADRGAGLLITHHPLIFPDIRSVDLSTGVGRAIAAALRGGVTIYAAHTNLDHAASGTSHALARVIGLVEISPLSDAGSPPESAAEDGIVVFGRLPSETTLLELAAHTKAALGAPAVRIVGDAGAPISTAAVCAGSGGDFVPTAHTVGVDALITGEVGYHAAARARDEGLSLIEVGHFWSEMPVVRLTAETVVDEAQKRKWDLSVVIIEGCDPYGYIDK
jgi:dinuclear metal center YbgI/SA1388 family protein